jgi:hypothetical protein
MPRPRESRWPKNPRRRNLPEWSSTGMFNIGIVMQKSTLAVMIMPVNGFWDCAAVSTPSSAGSMKDVFDEHGHKVLGRFTDIQKAINVCEAYARKWVKGQEKIERCECEEIMRHAKPALIDAEFEFEPDVERSPRYGKARIAELGKRRGRARAQRKRAA